MEETLPKAYDPKSTEAKWTRFWIEKELFRATETPPRGKKTYCIVIPPPNVTGVLHMGHALNNTLQDVLVRYKRMDGFETLWQAGTDHAGIATQNVVEREILEKEGKSRHDLGREELIRRIWEWKEEYGERILKQLQAIGSSCDWSRTRFTLDEGLSRAVRECFLRLYKKGLIYRGKYIVNWCPRCHTALADDEVEHEEHKGHLWHIRYPFRDDPKRGLTVATTRPETLLGDVAVAVNPKDKRYRPRVGMVLLLPEVGREIPVIADNFVDPKFGSGCVKVTPAHDPNDFQMGLRHRLEPVNVMNASAEMNENVPAKYRGMTREACRIALVEALEKQGLLEKTEEHGHAVGHCYRCHTVVEPWLSEQWFVKMKPLAAAAIRASKKGKVKFHPARWEKFYLSWLEEVRDWCISRQIWWGHRIPVWYCAKGCEPIAALETPHSCPRCGGKDLKQDEDVLDTWFSSALWPFSTLGWPEKTASLKAYYSTDVLITDRGIIFFWVARMVMMGLEMTGKEPFGNVYIHGTILDKFGRKMSKSKPETCIDPLGIIDRYGADALRYSLLLLTTEGQDLKLDEGKFDTGRHFCNKLWNAARFALMNLEGFDGKEARDKELTLADKWIWNRYQKTVSEIRGALDGYKYFEASRILYRFIWNEFCDWYLEMIKPFVRESRATQWNLRRVLEGTLRLAHPFLPFITEELWQRVPPPSPPPQGGRVGEGASIVTAPFPRSERKIPFQAEAGKMEILKETVAAVRNLRGEHNVNPRQKISAWFHCPDGKVRRVLETEREILKNLGVLEEIHFVARGEKPEKSAVAMAGPCEIYVPFRHLFDVEQERARLLKEMEKTKGDAERFEKKLENANFAEKAPRAVVEKEREKLAAAREQLGKLRDALKELS